MQDLVSYYSEHDAEDAMSVIAGWMSNDHNIKVVYHSGNQVDANIFTHTIRVPRLSCASGLTQEALMLLRGRIYHEAGHIDVTVMDKSDYPKAGILSDIWSALEDRRMESVESKKHKGCEVVFAWSIDYYNKKIAEKMMSGSLPPVTEALMAMTFMVEAKIPLWTVSEQAKGYVDVAYPKFSSVKSCKNARASLVLAKEIYEILKQKKQDEQDDQEKSEEKSGESEKSDEKSGESEKSEKSEKSDEKSEKSDKSDEKSDKSDKSNEKNKEGVENEEQDGDGNKSESSESEESEESDGEGSAGDENGKDDEGEPEEDDAGEIEYQKGKEVAGKNNAVKKTVKEIKKELEGECNGFSSDDCMNEEIAKYFAGLPKSNLYTSRRDLDEHASPVTGKDDKAIYKKRYESIASEVSSMSRALEQALKAMSKCKKSNYMRQGKIDLRRLVPIARATSKEVFYKTRPGMNLDVAVEIIVDESGSMQNSYEVQLFIMAISESLNTIGIPFEVTGTTTKYGYGSYMMPPMDGFSRTNPIVYKHYKKFNEKWQSIRERLIHSGAIKHNVDGETVEYAAFRLKQRPEVRKVIFSISDGAPQSGQLNDYEMGENLKNVCSRVRGEGIEVYGFGIGTSDPKQYYSEKFFMKLDSADAMGQKFVAEFAKIITDGKVKV